MKHRIMAFIRKETVLTVAMTLALLSMLLVMPDAKYSDYIDTRTLGLLFSLMLVMAGFRDLGVFERLGNILLSKTKSLKGVAAVLVFLCFFTSMLITNDVALLTFVPFAVVVLTMAEAKEALIPVVVLQTVAANLGSMLLPFGNPQNLYLYSLSDLTILTFIKLLLPFTLVSLVLLSCQLQLLPKKELHWKPQESPEKFQKREQIHFAVYGITFLFCVLAVARILPWQWVIAGVTVVMLISNKRLFLTVDYSLLATFVAFFIFIGNLARIPEFSQILQGMIKGHEVIVSVAASQCISNVPAALLLSGFTSDYAALLIGCNLGGLGTLIASMASLISYKQIAKQFPEGKGRYMKYFTLTNILYLGILLLIYYLGK